MCGICGVVGLGRVTLDSRSAELDRMSLALAHRGPDDSGQWRDDRVSLAHRRLSIIDLEKSEQPMVSTDQRYVLVFNGEVLNYRDLRRAVDYPFKTSGDTEAVLAAHVAWGDAAIPKLAGQFAYCVYDTQERSLLLVRDRMGILPLYWWSDGSQFLFSSEMTSLVRGLPNPPSLSGDAIDAYLAGRSVPAPNTLVEGVHKLRPGHLLRLGPTGDIREEPYWQPTPTQSFFDLSPEAAVDELDRRLTAAVDRSMVADVPVGSYLSGGVDSSLIVSKAAAAVGSAPLHTFCAGFGDERNDETTYAEIVSQRFGTAHHVVDVRPDDFLELWPLLSRHRGAPLSEPADIAVYRLAQRAAEHVKVVLSGEGSDELFAGYPKHRMAGVTRAAGLVPGAVRAPLLAQVESRLPASARRFGVALRAMSEPRFADRAAAWFSPFTSAEREALTGRKPDTSSSCRRGDSLRYMMSRDLEAWLPDNLLERGDRMTMAASVEMRPPFLDERVVEFSLGLPSSLLVRKGSGKWLVKQVAARSLPPEVVDRRKSGFKVPLDRWFRQGLRDYAWDLVSARDSVTSNYLNYEAVASLFARHDHGRRDESIRVWTLASLEVWHRSLCEQYASGGTFTPSSGQ